MSWIILPLFMFLWPENYSDFFKDFSVFLIINIFNNLGSQKFTLRQNSCNALFPIVLIQLIPNFIACFFAGFIFGASYFYLAVATTLLIFYRQLYTVYRVQVDLKNFFYTRFFYVLLKVVLVLIGLESYFIIEIISLIIILFFYFPTVINSFWKLDFNLLKSYLSFSRPFYLLGVFSIFNIYSDRFFISLFDGDLYFKFFLQLLTFSSLFYFVSNYFIFKYEIDIYKSDFMCVTKFTRLYIFSLLIFLPLFFCFLYFVNNFGFVFFVLLNTFFVMAYNFLELFYNRYLINNYLVILNIFKIVIICLFFSLLYFNCGVFDLYFSVAILAMVNFFFVILSVLFLVNYEKKYFNYSGINS